MLPPEAQTHTWRSCGYLRRLGSRCGTRRHVGTSIPEKSVHLCKAGSIVVPTRLQALAVVLIWLRLGSVRRIISRCSLSRRNPWPSTLLVCTREAEIVLGVLIEVFRGDAVSANRGLAC